MERNDDELAIRQLAAQYADSVNRRDAEGMAAVFTEDAVIEKPGHGDPVKGIEKILKRYKRLQRERDFLVQMIHSGIVEIDGLRANARWWISEVKNIRDSDTWIYMIGIYQDNVVKLDSSWWFQKRSQTTIFEYQLKASEITTSPLPDFLSLAQKSINGGLV